MEIKDAAKISALDLESALGAENSDFSSVYDPDRKTLEVSFDKRKLSAPQILSAVMAAADVTDVQVKETELAQIVKQIYTRGLSAQDAQGSEAAAQ